MAYIVSTLQTATQATGTTYAVNFPSGVVANDLLLVKLSQDGSTESLAVAASGFTALGTQTESGACSSLWFFKIAAGGETSATFACANDDIIGTAILIRDAHATAPFGASPTSAVNFIRTDWNNVSSSGCGTLTPPEDECLLIYSWCSDGATQYMRGKIDQIIEVDKYASAQINHIIGCRQQQTAASTAGTATMYHPIATEGGNGWVLAVRNKSGGALQPDVRVTGTDWKWYGSWITQHDSVTWEAPSAFAASINSITCSSTAPTVDNTNAWAASSYGFYTILQSTESTAGSWVGGTHAVTSIDLTGKIIKIEMAAGHVSTGAVAGSEGWLIGFSDGTNWVVYQVKSRAKSWALQDPDSYWIAVGNATAYASSGTIASALSACTRVGFFQHRIGSPSTSSSQFHIKNLAYFTRFDLTGGGSARPATLIDLHNYASNWSHFRLTNIQGSAQVKPKVSVQIGDGTNKTYFDGATNSVGFPQAWSATTNNNWQMDWNVDAAIVTLGVKAASSDTIKLAAGAATSANAQLLTIASDSHSGATYDFAQAFGGFSVTWDTDIACANATFTGGGQVLGKGADFTDCIFKNSTAGTSAAVVGFDANGASMTGCTTEATSSTGYHIELSTSVTAFTLTDHTFTGSALTDKVHVLKTLTNVAAGAFVVGVHYRISTLGVGTDFTSFGASANTVGVNFTANRAGTGADGTGTADQAVKITISGTTSLAEADCTTAGAPVWISAPVVNQVAIVSGFTAGSRIQLYDCDYEFTVSGVSVNPAAGDVYSQNGVSYTIFAVSIAAGSGTIRCYGATIAEASGTLTRVSGSGDASITFSATADNGEELFNGTATGGNGVISGTTLTWTDPLAASASRYVRARISYVNGTSAKAFIEAIIGTCGTTSGTESISYLAAPTDDDSYNTSGLNGPTIYATSGITFTDAATDLVNCNVPSASVSHPTVYACFCYWIFTAAGIADDITYINSPDAANFIYTRMKFKNTSSPSVGLSVTGGWGRDATTGLSITLWDSTGGTIGFSSDHSLLVTTGSGPLTAGQAAELTAAAAATAEATATAVWSKTLPL